MRITQAMLEQAHEYMRQWIDQENWTDLNAALDHYGDTLYAAELLVSSGAIDSASIKKYGAECFRETAYESEKIIEELARRFRKSSQRKQLKHVRETYAECFIADCQECNHVSFVPDGNEDLYPELKTKCWSCGSENIETKRGIK